MKFIPTAIPDVILIEPTVFSDERGHFMEIRHDLKFAKAGIKYDFVQDNLSHSLQGVLRGLHYQVKKPQGKLVRVLVGEVFDVAVDLRRSSPTFGKWVSTILSAENQSQLWIPPGFAHGFYVLSSSADFVYCCTDFYAPEYERTIIWNDPDLAIHWPLRENQLPNISAKDAAGKFFKETIG
jgi:dTDP-4-dehydrorhamnose 3,5-epimerase